MHIRSAGIFNKNILKIPRLYTVEMCLCRTVMQEDRSELMTMAVVTMAVAMGDNDDERTATTP